MSRPVHPERRHAAAAGRIALFALLWWVLTEGNLYNAWFGAAMVVLATTISFRVWPPGAWRWRARELPTFMPWFLWHSLLGGIDVARRAFAPTLPLQPRTIRLRLRFDDEAAQVFLAWVVGLFPGTASLRLRDGMLTVHVLPPGPAPEAGIRRLEVRVARLFGVPLAGGAIEIEERQGS
jgi:multicomponent Na+:H+ antiporter subunit E